LEKAVGIHQEFQVKVKKENPTESRNTGFFIYGTEINFGIIYFSVPVLRLFLLRIEIVQVLLAQLIVIV